MAGSWAQREWREGHRWRGGAERARRCTGQRLDRARRSLRGAGWQLRASRRYHLGPSERPLSLSHEFPHDLYFCQRIARHSIRRVAGTTKGTGPVPGGRACDMESRGTRT